MKHISFCFILFYIFFSAFSANAQSDPFLTQNWAIPTLFNPANAGETDFLRVRGAGRFQWVHSPDYTKYFLASADMPLELHNSNLGLGATFYNRDMGLFSNLSASLQANFQFKFSKSRFSAGVNIGYFNAKYSGDRFIEDSESNLSSSDSLLNKKLSGNAIDIAAGILYQHPYFHVGISVLHLTGNKIKLKPTDVNTVGATNYMEYKLKPSIYFDAGGNIPLQNSLFTLIPTVSFLSEFSDFYMQTGCRVSYKKFLSFGASYRLKVSIGLSVGGEFKNFFIGYAYDIPVTGIAKTSAGSHEVVIGYNLKLNNTSKPNYSQKSIRIM